MNEQTDTTKETTTNKETEQEISTNANAEQTTSEKSGSTSGQEKSEQVDNFSQMYDMLKERDSTIEKLTNEVKELKKQNTNLTLKVNASSSTADLKNPYEKFVDAMVKR